MQSIEVDVAVHPEHDTLVRRAAFQQRCRPADEGQHTRVPALVHREVRTRKLAEACTGQEARHEGLAKVPTARGGVGRRQRHQKTGARQLAPRHLGPVDQAPQRTQRQSHQTIATIDVRFQISNHGCQQRDIFGSLWPSGHGEIQVAFADARDSGPQCGTGPFSIQTHRRYRIVACHGQLQPAFAVDAHRNLTEATSTWVSSLGHATVARKDSTTLSSSGSMMTVSRTDFGVTISRRTESTISRRGAGSAKVRIPWREAPWTCTVSPPRKCGVATRSLGAPLWYRSSKSLGSSGARSSDQAAS